MELTKQEKAEQEKMNIGIRNRDDPRFKESITAELHGKFLGFIDSYGLTDGNEYKSQTKPIFSCSKRYIHIWDMDENQVNQIVVFLDSCQFTVEFGVYNKVEKKVIHRNKIELRYKLSSGTDPELTDGSQETFNTLFEDFKNKFNMEVKKEK